MQTCLTATCVLSAACLQVQAEQAAVLSKHGPTLTPAAYADMPYTKAVVKETLRAAQIIAYVPRVATRELKVPGGPTLPAGCPFIMALSAISASDPALQKTGDAEQFKPERCVQACCIRSHGTVQYDTYGTVWYGSGEVDFLTTPGQRPPLPLVTLNLIQVERLTCRLRLPVYTSGSSL